MERKIYCKNGSPVEKEMHCMNGVAYDSCFSAIVASTRYQTKVLSEHVRLPPQARPLPSFVAAATGLLSLVDTVPASTSSLRLHLRQRLRLRLYLRRCLYQHRHLDSLHLTSISALTLNAIIPSLTLSSSLSSSLSSAL